MKKFSVRLNAMRLTAAIATGAEIACEDTRGLIYVDALWNPAKMNPPLIILQM